MTKENNKIGILIDRFNVGGVEKIAIEEVRALRKLGVNAYLLVLRKKGVVDDAFLDLRHGLPTVYLDDRLPKFLRFSFKFPVFNFFSLFHLTYPFLIPFILKGKEFDYLIAHGTYTAFTAVGIKVFRRIRYSVFIWDPIGYILKKAYTDKFSIFMNLLVGIARLLDKLIISHSDYILVGGNAHNKYIKKINKNAKIKIISPSVHPSKKLNVKKDNFVLLVTAWKKGKSPEFIFELLKKIPNLRVKMVGKWIDLDYRKEFEVQIKERRLKNNIEITGEVSEAQLGKHYSQALVVFQINDDKGFGMPALEAAGHGTTFIIPKGQGVCSLFINKTDGFFIKEKNVKESVMYLSKFLKDKKLAFVMGNNAWQKVKSKYSWEDHARHLIQLA